MEGCQNYGSSKSQYFGTAPCKDDKFANLPAKKWVPGEESV